MYFLLWLSGVMAVDLPHNQPGKYDQAIWFRATSLEICRDCIPGQEYYVDRSTTLW